MPRPEIIAGEVQNLTDARYFAAREVTYLSFRFDGNFSAQQAAAIREWVDGVQMMGAFDFKEAEEIRSVASFAQLNPIELGMLADPMLASSLSDTFRLFQRIIIEADTTPEQLMAHIQAYDNSFDAFILDFRRNHIPFSALIEGHPLSGGFLAELTATKTIFLSISLRAEELQPLLHQIRPKGLEIIGGAEEKTGFKSFDEADDLFDALEEQFG